MADDHAATYLPAAHRALEAFALDVTSTALVTVSENVTFKVGTSEGAYVLRLHRPGYHDLAELESERLWIRALGAAGIDVPSPVRTRDGREYTRVDVRASGEQRYAGLTHWTEGEVLFDVLERLHDVATIEAYYEQLGALAAAMHDQATAWCVPVGFKRHSLDEDGLLGPTPFWGPFWEHPIFTAPERRLVIRVRDRIRERLVKFGRNASTYSLIHADLHSGNVLVHDGRLMVIDFDDAGFGWHPYDIAVALGYQRRHAHFAAMERAFVAGYRARRALPEPVLALVPTFMMVRDMAVLGWIHQRPELERTDAGRIRDRLCAQCERYLAEDR